MPKDFGDEVNMKKSSSSFGERLEQLCKSKGTTAAELARRISVSKTTVHDWIGRSGRMPRDPEHLKKLCDFFNVSSAYLLWGEEEKTISLDELISKTDIHTGMYQITIQKIDQKTKK